MGEALSVSEYRGVTPRDSEEGQMASEDVSMYRVVRPGQLAANVMWLNRSGLGVSRHLGYVSPAYKVFDISNSLDLRYADYLLRSTLYRAIFESLGRGVRPNAQMVDTFELKAIPIPLPHTEEQKRIADFLDRETAKIDALIDKQCGIIALLRERRRTMISKSVRSGISHGLPMVQSGIDWVGPYPAHWRLMPLRRVCRSTAGAGFPLEEQGVLDEQYPFYKVNVLARADADGVIRVREDTISPITAARLGAKVLPRGTLVMAKIGAALMLGRVRILSSEACIDNNMMGLTPLVGVASRFLFYALQDIKMELLVNPGAIPSLSERAMRGYQVAVPPLPEQSEIADYLDRESARIDALIAKAEEVVDLARERRAALITAAVTGQLDVRDARQDALSDDLAASLADDEAS